MNDTTFILTIRDDKVLLRVKDNRIAEISGDEVWASFIRDIIIQNSYVDLAPLSEKEYDEAKEILGANKDDIVSIERTKKIDAGELGYISSVLAHIELFGFEIEEEE